MTEVGVSRCPHRGKAVLVKEDAGLEDAEAAGIQLLQSAVKVRAKELGKPECVDTDHAVYRLFFDDNTSSGVCIVKKVSDFVKSSLGKIDERLRPLILYGVFFGIRGA